MRILGILLLLFGVGTLVVHFMEIQVDQLAWIGNWGDEAAWGIRGGATLLGLILLMAGGKKKDGKKK